MANNNYYQKNKLEILARAKKKRQASTPEQKESKKIYAKKYYQKNKARMLKRQKEYALTDAGKASRKKATRKHYEVNKNSLREKDKEYYFKRKLAILQGNNL